MPTLDAETKIMINKSIRDAPTIINLNKEEMQQIIKNPMTKALYESAVKKNLRKPRASKHPQIFCEVCKGSYTQSNVTRHRKSKHHMFCEELNKKWLSLLYD
jgi:hypothetical protein